jgi:DNA invertase Pin-like site-specific DNA recombinase
MSIVIVYERVSTDAQDITRQAVQRERAAAAYPDAELVVIQDDGVSAFKVPVFDRLGGAHMCDLVRTGDVVAIWTDAQDRLSRGDDVEWVTFRAMADSNDTNIVVDGQPITRDMGGRLLSYMKAELARQESVEKSHRVKSGMAVAAAKGRVNGGPRRFGFEPGDGSGTLTPRPSEIEAIQLMFDWARAGKSQTDIARDLNAAGHTTATGRPWSQPKVGEMLSSRIWLGILDNQAGEHRVMDEPLIDPELWHEVQRAYGKSGERRGRPSETFLLTNGLLRCGCCGSAMRTRAEHWNLDGRKTYEHYSCSGRRSGATMCKQPAIPRHRIDRAVLAYFENVALDMSATLEHLTGERDRRIVDVDAKLRQARKVITDAERQTERLDAMMRDEGLTLDEWRRLAAVPQREAEAAGLAIDDLRAEREQVASAVEAIDAAGDFIERISALRASVAGEIASASGVAATRVALRRVFDGFVLHRADAPAAPRRVDAELAFVDGGYVIEPLVADDALLGTMPAGTPVVERVPLELVGSANNKRSGR